MPEPVQWGSGREQAFTNWISWELDRAIADRQSLERKWRDWLDQYRAPFDSTIKHFPYEGASNRTIPVTAMNVDPMVARDLTTMHAPPDLWTLQALNERWVDLAKPLQDYLTYLSVNVLNMWDVNYRASREKHILGTSIYKHGWFFEQRAGWDYDAQGKAVRVRRIVSHPLVDHVKLIDFLIPPGFYAIQPDAQGGAPWVAEHIALRQDQFLARAVGQEPFLPQYNPQAVAKVQAFTEQGRSEVEKKVDELENYQPSDLQRIHLYEVHARYDCSGKNTVDDVVAIVHRESRTLLRAVYQPYRHGARPYEVARYLRTDGFYGRGLGEICETFQDVQSELANFSMDNVLLGNSVMLGVKSGANVVPGEPIYPGKIWALDDPRNDINPIPMAQTRSDLPILSQYFQGQGERATGLGDLQFGSMQTLPSRTPATTMMSLLQEGGRRFDLILKDTRVDCLSRIGLRILQNLQQFAAEPRQNPDGSHYLALAVQVLGEPEGSKVAQVLQMPLEDVSAGLGVSLTATSGSVNKEMQKQAYLALVQLQTQIGQQMLGLAQVAANPVVLQTAPQLADIAVQSAKGLTELQRRLLEQYDIPNSEDILVDASVLQSAANQIRTGVPVQPGGPYGLATALPAGSAGPEGMGGLPPAA